MVIAAGLAREEARALSDVRDAGQAVIVARPEWSPQEPDAVQALADRVVRRDVFSASPRVVGDDEADSGDAPSPWFCAVNRQAWLDRGGASGDGPWTSGLDDAGRRVVVESATVLRRRAGRAPAVQRSAAPAAVVAAAPAVAGGPAAFGFSDGFPAAARTRLLVFADGFGASQSLAFVDGLARARARGEVAVRIVEERALPRDAAAAEDLAAAIEQHFAETAPSIVVLSRFGHDDAARRVIEAARARKLPVVAHLDDDLFDLPAIIGIERYRLSRHPRRVQALHRGLAAADLVMAATPTLAQKIGGLAGHDRVGWMEIGSAGRPHVRAPGKGPDDSLVIGYMGSASHNHDLEMLAPALNAVLERFDHVSVELFGSISQQPAAELLRGRVRKHRPVSGDYGGFKAALAGMGWDVGLAPLRPIAYNRFKTPTKWVEYAEAGIATIVSDCEVYQPMIVADAALAAGPEQWESAMRLLVEQPELRADLVSAADRLLRSSYGWERLEAGVLDLLRRAEDAALAA